MKLKLFSLACTVGFLAFPGSATAQRAEDDSIVSLFVQTCTRGDVNAEAIVAGLSGANDWSEVQNPNVDVRALTQVPSQAAQGAFRRPESVRQWQQTRNGRQVSIFFATLPAGDTYRYVCALLVPDIRNAIPYLEAMRNGMRAIGLSARSTDLPHYQEYSGRLSDRRRARADIFSRSRTVEAHNTMHMYIAFEPPSSP